MGTWRRRCAAGLIALSNGAGAVGDPDSLASVVAGRLASGRSSVCVAVGLVTTETQVEFACSQGAGPPRYDLDSIFEIGSITKGFTGLLLADMVRKGEVSLDDKASKYSRPGAKMPARGGEDITLRSLVTQTSGLPRLPPGFLLGSLANPDPYARFDADALYAALERTDIANGNGRYEYSNFAFMWLSEILARRGAKPFEALLEERILDPLGMRDTAITLSPQQRKRFIAGHDAAYREVPHWDFAGDLGGAGALRSSLRDMMKLASALAGRTHSPLDETIALALQPMRHSTRNLSTGYAWVTLADGDKRVQWHNGETGGFHATIAVDRAARAAAVVLVDAAVSFDDLAIHLVDPQFPLAAKR